MKPTTRQLVVCTVITPDYVDRALSIYRSIRNSVAQVKMVALVTGDPLHQCDEIELLTLTELTRINKRARRAAAIYPEAADELRWTLKSIMLIHLMGSVEGDLFLYADPDTCFFQDPAELSLELHEGGILLTPHWRPLDPSGPSQPFLTNFTDGIFNAGLVVARHSGRAALEWWADACLVRCDLDYSRGLFADQKYLDLLPIWFPETVICRNRGYNLADWNIHLRECDLTTGLRDVPDRWPVSMVHFTANTIDLIESGGDPVLSIYLKEYEEIRATASRDLHLQRSLTTKRSSPFRAAADTNKKEKWLSIVQAAREKLPTQTLSHALTAAAAFARRLSGASIKAVICDYDTLVIKGDSRSPSAFDRRASDRLRSLVELGMVVGLVSRRGFRFVDRVSAATPASHSSSIWIGCFSGELVGPLSGLKRDLRRPEAIAYLLENIDRRFGKSSVQVSTHLSRGGQITLHVEQAQLTTRVHLGLSQLLDELGLSTWRALRSGNTITILDPSVSKLRLADAIRAHYGLSIDEILCIGLHGAEGEGDHELLSTPLSLSVGSTSLDPTRCWRFSNETSARYPAFAYLEHLQGDRGLFTLPMEHIAEARDRVIAYNEEQHLHLRCGQMVVTTEAGDVGGRG